MKKFYYLLFNVIYIYSVDNEDHDEISHDTDSNDSCIPKTRKIKKCINPNLFIILESTTSIPFATLDENQVKETDKIIYRKILYPRFL